MHWTLSTALDANAVPLSMHCASSVGSTDVMVLGSYKFILIFDIKHVTLSIQTLPCFCFIVFIILLLIGNHTSSPQTSSSSHEIASGLYDPAVSYSQHTLPAPARLFARSNTLMPILPRRRRGML